MASFPKRTSRGLATEVLCGGEELRASSPVPPEQLRLVFSPSSTGVLSCGGQDPWVTELQGAQAVIFQDARALGRLVKPRVLVDSPGELAPLSLVSLIYDYWQPTSNDRKLGPEQHLRIPLDSRYRSTSAFSICAILTGRQGGAVALPGQHKWSGSKTAAAVSQHQQRLHYIRTQQRRYTEGEGKDSPNRHPLARSEAEFTIETGPEWEASSLSLTFNAAAELPWLQRIILKLLVADTTGRESEATSVSLSPNRAAELPWLQRVILKLFNVPKAPVDDSGGPSGTNTSAKAPVSSSSGADAPGLVDMASASMQPVPQAPCGQQQQQCGAGVKQEAGEQGPRSRQPQEEQLQTLASVSGVVAGCVAGAVAADASDEAASQPVAEIPAAEIESSTALQSSGAGAGFCRRGASSSSRSADGAGGGGGGDLAGSSDNEGEGAGSGAQGGSHNVGRTGFGGGGSGAGGGGSGGDWEDPGREHGQGPPAHALTSARKQKPKRESEGSEAPDSSALDGAQALADAASSSHSHSDRDSAASGSPQESTGSSSTATTGASLDIVNEQAEQRRELGGVCEPRPTVKLIPDNHKRLQHGDTSGSPCRGASSERLGADAPHSPAVAAAAAAGVVPRGQGACCGGAGAGAEVGGRPSRCCGGSEGWSEDADAGSVAGNGGEAEGHGTAVEEVAVADGRQQPPLSLDTTHVSKILPSAAATVAGGGVPPMQVCPYEAAASVVQLKEHPEAITEVEPASKSEGVVAQASIHGRRRVEPGVAVPPSGDVEPAAAADAGIDPEALPPQSLPAVLAPSPHQQQSPPQPQRPYANGVAWPQPQHQPPLPKGSGGGGLEPHLPPQSQPQPYLQQQQPHPSGAPSVTHMPHLQPHGAHGHGGPLQNGKVRNGETAISDAAALYAAQQAGGAALAYTNGLDAAAMALQYLLMQHPGGAALQQQQQQQLSLPGMVMSQPSHHMQSAVAMGSYGWQQQHHHQQQQMPMAQQSQLQQVQQQYAVQQQQQQQQYLMQAVQQVQQQLQQQQQHQLMMRGAAAAAAATAAGVQAVSQATEANCTTAAMATEIVGTYAVAPKAPAMTGATATRSQPSASAAPEAAGINTPDAREATIPQPQGPSSAGSPFVAPQQPGPQGGQVPPSPSPILAPTPVLASASAGAGAALSDAAGQGSSMSWETCSTTSVRSEPSTAVAQPIVDRPMGHQHRVQSQGNILAAHGGGGPGGGGQPGSRDGGGRSSYRSRTSFNGGGVGGASGGAPQVQGVLQGGSGGAGGVPYGNRAYGGAAAAGAGGQRHGGAGGPHGYPRGGGRHDGGSAESSRPSSRGPHPHGYGGGHLRHPHTADPVPPPEALPLPDPKGSCDLDRFISQIEPVIAIDPAKPPEQALKELRLRDLWNFYFEPSLYGREVFTLGGHRGASNSYFVPYLSAIQIFTRALPTDVGGTNRLYVSEDNQGWPKHMHLKFEYFEQELPFNRLPLYDQIELLSGMMAAGKTPQPGGTYPAGAGSAAPGRPPAPATTAGASTPSAVAAPAAAPAAAGAGAAAAGPAASAFASGETATGEAPDGVAAAGKGAAGQSSSGSRGSDAGNPGPAEAAAPEPQRDREPVGRGKADEAAAPAATESSAEGDDRVPAALPGGAAAETAPDAGASPAPAASDAPAAAAAEAAAAAAAPPSATFTAPGCGGASTPPAPTAAPAQGPTAPDGGDAAASGSGGGTAAGTASRLLYDMRLLDVHPASWFAVAWYPVYRIPDAPLYARFLTFHSFAPLVESMRNAHDRLVRGQVAPYYLLSLPVVGLNWYNMQGERWMEPLDESTVAGAGAHMHHPHGGGHPPPVAASAPGGGAAMNSPRAPHRGGGGRVPGTDVWYQHLLHNLQSTADRLARGVGLRVLGQHGAEEVRLRVPDYEFFRARS